MRLRISHRTAYRYESAPAFAAQLLRLTPRTGPGQKLLRWRVDGGGDPRPWTDAFGNACHLATFEAPANPIVITAGGEVVTADAAGVTPAADGEPAPAVFLRQSARTRPSGAMAEFAAEFAAPGPDALRRLADAVRERVGYRSGVTHVRSTAAESFAEGFGVCQDHAHVFIGCARRAGVPARYVSGYLYDGDHEDPRDASHAWAEAWVDGLGWVGLDVSNGIPATDRHVALAVGIDYDSASPVRGMRSGDAVGEVLEVSISVNAA